jgi:hypothetical protein
MAQYPAGNGGRDIRGVGETLLGNGPIVAGDERDDNATSRLSATFWIPAFLSHHLVAATTVPDCHLPDSLPSA